MSTTRITVASSRAACAHLRARETDDERRRDRAHEDRRRHEAQPGAAGDDRREDVEVRVANRVARAAPLGPEPQPDERRDDEQAEQHPRALEAHRRPRAQRVDLDDRADACELGVAAHADDDAARCDPLRARHARDEARARRRACREPERVRSAHEALAGGAALNDRRRPGPDAHGAHASGDGSAGAELRDRGRNARAASRLRACSR